MAAIFALQLISEIQLSSISSMPNNKAAFDSVDHLALWKPLHGWKVHDFLLNLTISLHGEDNRSRKESNCQTDFKHPPVLDKAVSLPDMLHDCNRLDP